MPALTRAVPERYSRRHAATRVPAVLRILDGPGCSFSGVAEFGLFGFGISDRARLALAVFLERSRAAGRVRGRFSPWLLKIGRIVDHRSQVALICAAEIVVVLIFGIAAVQNRGPKILRPQPAGARNRCNPRITQPDCRKRPRIIRM